MYILYGQCYWKMLCPLCSWPCYKPGDFVAYILVDAYQYFIGSYELFLLILGSHLLGYVFFISFHFMYFTFH